MAEDAHNAGPHRDGRILTILLPAEGYDAVTGRVFLAAPLVMRQCIGFDVRRASAAATAAVTTTAIAALATLAELSVLAGVPERGTSAWSATAATAVLRSATASMETVAL